MFQYGELEDKVAGDGVVTAHDGIDVPDGACVPQLPLAHRLGVSQDVGQHEAL